MTTHRFILQIILCVGFLTQGEQSIAQGVVFSSREHPQATLIGQPQGLSVLDSGLYLYTSGVLMKACWQNGEVVGFIPDTDFVKTDADINYIVCQPSTGDLYYTKLDRKGHSCLYVAHRDGKRVKTKRVKFDDIEVEHPTFSADGQVMVFSSVERRRSYGGYDLWYSTLREGNWSSPVNIGNRVNSPGDDVTPTIVGDYLFFSSNGREESHRHLNIYATRLIARQVMGDTIGMLQIGRSRVQQLPQGINSAVSDCYDFVIDTLRHCCYWVNASSGLRSYSGALDAVTLWGYTTNSLGQPLAGVHVTAFVDNQAVAMASSGSDGFYRLTLPAPGTFNLLYNQPLRFSHHQLLHTALDDAGNLIGETRLDVFLDSLPIQRPILYTDLFGPDAVIDLTPHGIETLQSLVTFITDNPGLQADLTLRCDLTDNASFNALLTAQRLQRLSDYLRSVLPASVVIRMYNGCEGADGCAGATGDVRLSVILK